MIKDMFDPNDIDNLSPEQFYEKYGDNDDFTWDEFVQKYSREILDININMLQTVVAILQRRQETGDYNTPVSRDELTKTIHPLLPHIDSWKIVSRLAGLLWDTNRYCAVLLNEEFEELYKQQANKYFTERGL